MVLLVLLLEMLLTLFWLLLEILVVLMSLLLKGRSVGVQCHQRRRRFWDFSGDCVNKKTVLLGVSECIFMTLLILLQSWTTYLSSKSGGEANIFAKSFTNLGHSTPISIWNLSLIQMEKRAKKPHYAFVAFHFASSVAAVLVMKRWLNSIPQFHVNHNVVVATKWHEL